MVNVFTLGIIFTSLELAWYLLRLIGRASIAIYIGMLKTDMLLLVGIVIAIVCSILELIGIRKKHYGLSRFSVVFRSISVILCIIIEIIYLKNMPNEDIDECQGLTRKDKKIAEKIFTAVSFDECKA